MRPRPIIHVEFSAQDPSASAAFYREVFGWQTSVDERFKYHQFTAQGGPGGGFVEVGEEYRPGEVIVYILTDDLDTTLRDIEAAGGEILVTKTEIPATGWFAWFADPGGNKVGLFSRMDDEVW